MGESVSPRYRARFVDDRITLLQVMSFVIGNRVPRIGVSFLDCGRCVHSLLLPVFHFLRAISRLPVWHARCRCNRANGAEVVELADTHGSILSFRIILWSHVRSRGKALRGAISVAMADAAVCAWCGNRIGSVRPHPDGPGFTTSLLHPGRFAESEPGLGARSLAYAGPAAQPRGPG